MKAIIAIPATLALVIRASKKNSLTPAGLVAATLTAAAHAYHPWNLPFVLLCVFFLAGTRVTHIKENVKATMTVQSRGTPGGEGPRTHVQVFANSLMASILTVLHALQLRSRAAALADPTTPKPAGTLCYSWGGDLLVVGIIANYAAVAADTFSSELGILSSSQPRLISSWTLRKVPRGTNGGVTMLGLGAALLGSMVIVTAAMLFLPSCTPDAAEAWGGGVPWTMERRRTFMGFLVLWGALGSLLDSLLGGIFQRSVRDVRTGKIVEGEGGSRVLVSAAADLAAATGVSGARAEAKATRLGGESEEISVVDEGSDEGTSKMGKYDMRNKHRRPSFGDQRPSRVVESGWDLLDNNDVNFLMASLMSVGAMAVASWFWGVPIESVMQI
ncbi:DUF92 domain protein [Drechmeria coniospora]|uniref:DUF92 domain protein n=1 Tax=Drechmeria coniospora TaxID=98403 RepID=A0A151GV62_DRECN|nr:DUF92 domain protein [Drechmeria coniospora]KYK60961.1 DUF92 domain protein [Drechmeria coniospora]ODA83645.1 hypothetical protein RJ55_02160 [Drechmeria coniospora]